MRFVRVIGIFALLFVIGCSQETKTYKVTGTVSFDGTPVSEGDILFIPVEREFRAEGGRIKDGQFNFQARAGKKRVEIRAARATSGKKGPMGEPVPEDYIPERYNAATTLSEEVLPNDENKFNFPLRSR